MNESTLPSVAIDQPHAVLASIVDRIPTNVMLADRDGTIIYLNEAAFAMFYELRDVLPTVPGALVGTSMDVCLVDPAKQRAMIQDPGGFPLTRTIEYGTEVLELTLDAVYDEEGGYIGPFVTWKRVTETRRQAEVLEETRQREVALVQEMETTVDLLLETVAGAASGDLTLEVPACPSGALSNMGDGIAALLRRLRDDIGRISDTASLLASAAEEMSAPSRTLSDNSTDTTQRSQALSSASTQVSEHISTVAAGTEEMSASIREISQNTARATEVAASAVRLAEETNQTIAKLGDSSAEIGQVIKVITSIAQQTNLLALNATIEAARAGQAGKGFAVVANEVKELAKETAKATGDISQRIETIQGDTMNAVEAIEKIGTIIEQIDEIQATIASSVEQQTATTNEIARSVAAASVGAADIAESGNGVAERARDNSTGAQEVRFASDELARMASELQTLVEGFRI